VTPSSLVERRPGILCIVESYERSDFTTIRFCERAVRAPRRLLKVFEFIRDHEQFRVSDLPRLNPEGQVVMVRRLIKEGLLRFVEGSETADQEISTNDHTGVLEGV
jgi:hypothetical protein